MKLSFRMCTLERELGHSPALLGGNKLEICYSHAGFDGKRSTADLAEFTVNDTALYEP